jgi:cell division inhibitor SepF
MGLFQKEEKENEEVITSKDKMIMEQIIDDDKHAASLVDKLKAGCPLLLNFDKLDVFEANKLIAFFSGASYALDGQIVTIKEGTYLFARKEDFLDGSLRDFLVELKK